MNVSALEEKANILMQNVAGWENSVIERIGNRIKAIGEMSVADVKMLNNIVTVKQDMDEIIKDLAHVTGLNIREVLQIYGDTLAEQHLENNPLYDYRNKTFVPFADNTELQAIARAYAKTTAGTMLNLSKTKGLCVMNEHGRPIALKRYYTDILDKAVMQVASGATDFHSAMRQAITALGGSGVRVDYGGGITRRLDTVVRQTALYGAKQASVKYNEMLGKELGCDGIEIDYHRNSRPSQRFMQGKQYSIEGDIVVKGVLYKDATKAGVIDALNDYNCYHFKTPIICGVSVPAYDEEQLKQYEAEDDEEFTIDGKTQNGYGWSQDMRKLETAMREQKRIKVGAVASGDKELVKKCNKRINAYYAKYEQISEVTGIRQDPTRFTVPRQPRTVKDTLTSYNQSGIIKETKISSSVGMAKDNQIEWYPMGDKISKEQYKELREYAQNKGITLNGFKKSDVDIDLAKELIDDTSEILKEYPYLNYDAKRPFTLNLTYLIDNNTFAQVHPGVNHIINLNGNALRNKHKLDEEYGKLADEGFFVKGTNYHSIISHEMGHIISDYKGIDGIEHLKKILNINLSTDALVWCEENLSFYGGSQSEEILSESFSAYKANKANKIIVELLRICGFIK